jgi:hypothetical protein
MHNGGVMKNKSFNSLFTRMVHFGIMMLLFCPAIGKGQETKLTELNISMTLINLRDKSSTNLSSEDAELTTKKIIMKENDNIQKLLTGNGIYADGESIGILYHLNPGMDPKSIKAGAEILFPVIKMKKQLASSSKEDCLVALTLDKKIKQDFINTIKQFDIVAAGISSLSFNSSIPPEVKDKFIALTKPIMENMETFKVLIRERTRPLSSEMILQMNDEGDQMISIIEKITHKNYILTNNDIESIELIAKNMTIRMKTLDEAKGAGGISSNWPEVSVFVRAIDVSHGKEINNLRVYYVGQGLWNDRIKYEKSFDKLTSPSERILPEADYYIWVGKPQDSTPLSDRKSLEVRKKAENEKIGIDLIIK